MFNNKRIKALEKKVEKLKKEQHELYLIINNMWEETHPQTMGGQ